MDLAMDVAFLFPGQGSQRVGMGLDLYNNYEVSRQLLDNASDFCKIDFKKVMFEQNDLLGISEYTQPAIVLNSFMSYLAFSQHIKLQPKFCIGHSLGEFSAIGVSGGFDMLEAVKIVHFRGKFMAEACEGKGAGMMVVLGLDDGVVEEICKSSNKSVWAANYNCDSQVVVAGLRQDLESLQDVFKAAGAKRTMLLDMSVASHCPILQSASDKLLSRLSFINDEFGEIISNVTAKPYNSKKEAMELLKLQLVRPVLYKQSIMQNSNRIDCFIEFGSSVLKGLNKKITDKPTYSIFDLNSLQEAVEEF